ncbi:uncharacterized protein LOC144174524 isoform X2 [Haemaphysalis longicornis]
MNEHASLYEYWRKLLMEEQQNEERNHWLMRKLDEIEQRTSLLSERSDRLRQLRENFSELIRERYLSPEEMSYTYDYNPPSKAIEHSPPEYIPDPILFGLSTPPWIPRGGPFLPSRQATPERWKSPQPPPAASVPQPAQRQQHPRAPSPHPATTKPRGSPADRRPRYPPGETSEPWFNNFANDRGESLLEPSVSWLPDSEEFFRTTSALERQPAAGTKTMAEHTEEARAAVGGASTAQQHRPSRMSQFSDYIPSNESPPASRRRPGPLIKPPELEGVLINHTTEVLLSDPAATGKKQQREDARRKSSDDTSGGDSFHQGDTDEKRHDPKSIPSLRLRRPSRNRGPANRSREAAPLDSKQAVRKRQPGSFKQSTREAGHDSNPASRQQQPHAAQRNGRTKEDGDGRKPSSTSKPNDPEEGRASRRAGQQLGVVDGGHSEPQREKGPSDRSDASGAGAAMDSEWSVSCGEQREQSETKQQDTSKQASSPEAGRAKEDPGRQERSLHAPTEKRRPSWDAQSADRPVKSAVEAQAAARDLSEQRKERRSVPGALVESRHLAGHSDQLALPSAEKQESGRQSRPTHHAGDKRGDRLSDKPRSRSRKHSQSLSSSSSSSSLSSDSPKQVSTGAAKGRSHENSEDSFFDKDILPNETTAYQFLLGNVKPSAPEKPSVVDHPSESSTDIENEMAAAVKSRQPKFKTGPEEHEDDAKGGSNDSSPPEYDVTSVNIQNLISAKVKHDVPSLISRKVLGIDMYAEPKILQSQKCDDEDSFFD